MLKVLLIKDILIELRGKEIVVSMTAFGVSVILLYAFGSDTSSDSFLSFFPGLLWIVFLFVAIIAFQRSFSIEKEMDAFSLLLSAPVERTIIFLSKCITSCVYLVISQLIILPIFYLFLSTGSLREASFSESWFTLGGVVILTDCCLACLGSLVAGIVMRVKMSEILFPILFFPLISPVLIASVKCTSALLWNLPFIEWKIWLQLLVTFGVVFFVTGYVIFEHVTEE